MEQKMIARSRAEAVPRLTGLQSHLINSQIDEILDNNLYDRICNERIHFLQNDESPLISNYDYVSKVKIAADKLGNELAAQLKRESEQSVTNSIQTPNQEFAL